MNSLDFMIVGAQKGGTTALASFLAEHPDIAMAEGKEVHLFDAQDYSSAWTPAEINARYARHFPADNHDRLRGEATPIYLYWSDTAAELARYNPQLKIIVMLRDPVERAISHYMMERGRGAEGLPMWLALLLERFRLLGGRKRDVDSPWRKHSYIERGFYHRQLLAYRKEFPDRQILILENGELLENHAEVMTRVYQFLGVSAHPDSESRRVFTGDYSKKAGRLYRPFLRLRYRSTNRQLKNLLLTMGYKADWPWLN